MKSLYLFLTCVMVSSVGHAQSFVSLEVGSSWQSRNDQRVPGATGDLFSVSDFSQGPFATGRLYLGHRWGRHEIRGLYAPLEVKVSGEFDRSIRFVNTTFAANTATEARYKFNSYRLTYAYYLEPRNDWDLAVGFTGKIRDAQVELVQGSLSDQKSNIGFVPLLNFQAKKNIFQDLFFRFDFDGLAAPQGRAFDAAFFLDYAYSDTLQIFGGYRTVEGGADNDEVYNFAWFHTATLGLRSTF